MATHTKRRRAKDHTSPDPEQREAIRTELHAAINHICDTWPAVITQADEMGRGYPAATMNDGGGSSESTLVESQALDPRFDPAHIALLALAEWQQTIRQIRRVDRAFRGVTTTRPNLGRVSSLAGQCLCCQRDVLGTAEDRLRNGYCDACRKAWERAGRPDRAWFERQRREQAS